MKIKNISSFIIFLITIGCCHSKPQTSEFEVVQLSENTLPPLIPLKLEKIELPEDYTMGINRCYVYHDSVLLILKTGDPYPLTHLLTIVNMNSWEKIGEYFTRGQGPGELLSAIGFLSNNYLDINCYVTGKIIPFNIDSAIIKGNNYNVNVITPKENIIADYCSINDSLIFATNMFYFDGCEKFKTKDIPEFIKIHKNGTLTPEFRINKKTKNFPGNVTGCELSINKEKKRIICCYHFQPCIKIYDMDLNQIMQINGPEPNDGKYKVEDNGMLYFDYDKGTNHYYRQSFCDSNNIFVLNRRNHNDTSLGSEFIDIEKETTEIFRLDWNGEIIGRYSAKGYEILNTSFCKNSKTMFLYLKNNEGERLLCKAAIVDTI